MRRSKPDMKNHHVKTSVLHCQAGTPEDDHAPGECSHCPVRPGARFGLRGAGFAAAARECLLLGAKRTYRRHGRIVCLSPQTDYHGVAAVVALTVLSIEHQLKRVISSREPRTAIEGVAGLTWPHDQQLEAKISRPGLYGLKQLGS